MAILEGIFPGLTKAVPSDTKEMATKHFEEVAAELQTLRCAIDKYEGIDRAELKRSRKFSTKRDFGIYVYPGVNLGVYISDSSSLRNKGAPLATPYIGTTVSTILNTTMKIPYAVKISPA